MLQLPFISPLKNTLETLHKGARGGSCEPCQESKEVIKLYIVDYTGPLSALLDDLFNNIIASPPSRRGRKAMCAKRQGFPTGLSRGASRAALSSCALCSNPFSASRRSSYFAPACGGISPLPLARF